MTDAQRAPSGPQVITPGIVRFCAELWIAKGHMTGIVSHLDPADHATGTLEQLEEVAEVEKYVKVRESQLPEGLSHVMRGAEYEVKT